MELERDIHPLTDFKRRTSEFVVQLRETGRPVVLTINGRAELVVQDARSYQRLLDVAERLATIEAVKAGLASVGRGEGRGVEAVFADLEAAIRAQAAGE
jgi:prevent-host-death family protein